MAAIDNFKKLSLSYPTV